ncbi:hypothetical protein Pfo_031666, partial [Paulownia fortunei]
MNDKPLVERSTTAPTTTPAIGTATTAAAPPTPSSTARQTATSDARASAGLSHRHRTEIVRDARHPFSLGRAQTRGNSPPCRLDSRSWFSR